MSTEHALQRFPKNITLKDGLRCAVRPLLQDDKAAFHQFFLSVPDQERLFIEHRVTDREVIHDCCQASSEASEEPGPISWSQFRSRRGH